MLVSLKLKNFRNFSHKEVFFDTTTNLIVGENGAGKTNILEALSILCGKNILSLDFENLVKDEETIFFIEGKLVDGTIISVSYDIELSKKKIAINGKASTLQKLKSIGDNTVVFQPIDMNMMYLSPSLRRNFLDSILCSAYPEYEKLMKNYKLILRNRNSFLKSIGEGKAEKSEIRFWDTKFIEACILIYTKIFHLNHFIEDAIEKETLPYFFGKIHHITYKYITKVDEGELAESIQKYLQENFERDIIIGNTHIGPHVDDFKIRLGQKNIEDFASRGETKSVMIGLKMIETDYIRELTGKKPIVLIDDFLSEIDDKHREKLISSFDDYQTIITSISKLDFDTIINL